ncbi:hypothetical protein sphantq_04555 (plasmid) [Sphingobium sp. AntQ-1]|jgi:DNA-binding transcriptional ArsR family regulator|uniref:ArsR/SmtB family transcription factor n=1 Tax=Sphingobium sp. AntQ-1 TaxID=2930091 RepID=UPI00234F0DDF|nr:metalloregulator ArsR/SmtB family transcription factor [Sphingobium sp. AntQ-1]WCP16059.1 hypothetical protein sphantq_04555 [Sphingobium sp. AntQ-1]
MSAIYQARTQAEAAAEKLKIYAQPQRLMILSLLLNGEHIVSEIERLTGIIQPALSQQLAELRRAGVVTMRRASKQVHYSLANDDVTLCVRSIEAIFGTGEDKARALERVVAGEGKSATPSMLARPTAAAVFARIG